MCVHNIEVKCQTHGENKNVVCYSMRYDEHLYVIPEGCELHTECEKCIECRIGAGRVLMESMSLDVPQEEEYMEFC